MKFVVDMDMYPTGAKDIKVGMNEMKIFLVTSVYLKLVAFVKMDPSVYPEPPKPREISACK